MYEGGSIVRVRRAAIAALLLLPLSGCGWLFGDDDPLPTAPVPAADDRSPVPGQPPIVWIGGTVQEIGEARVTIQAGSDTPVRLQRLAAGATTFLADSGGEWRALTDEQVADVDVGVTACAEALLDGTNLVALRIFLGAACGPTGGVA